MSNLNNSQQDWVSLMEYAMNHGVSLSTLRRQIKANKIPHKLENGRYLLQGSNDQRVQLQKAHEEIAELKMLVAIYEEQLGLQPRQDIPHLDV